MRTSHCRPHTRSASLFVAGIFSLIVPVAMLIFGLQQPVAAQVPPLPTVIPGLNGNAADAATGKAVSDQKLGSVLFLNYYISDSLSATINTRISLTNANPVQDIAVHIFMVDSVNCTTADFFICLTRNQTTTFTASDLDPDTAGYLIAVAVDSDGKPVSFNYLGGEEYVVAPTGHRYGLSAVAAARLDGVAASPLNSDRVSSTIFFNGTQYDYLPQALMLDSFPSQTSSPGSSIGDTRMYVYSPINDLLTGTGRFTGNLFFLVYDDQENGFSGQLPLNCYLTSDKHRISSVRTAPNLSTIVPSGRTGWARFQAIGSTTVTSNVNGGTITLGGAPLLGAVATKLSAYNGGHNLRYLTSFAQGYSLTIPVITPDCGPIDFLPITQGSTL